MFPVVFDPHGFTLTLRDAAFREKFHLRGYQYLVPEHPGDIPFQRLECGVVIYMAVNTLRPFTSDPEQIAIMTSELSAAAGFKIDGYINNTNLLEETTAELVKEGESKVLEASKLTGVPLIANCVMEGVEIPEGMLANTELLRMSRRIHYAY